MTHLFDIIAPGLQTTVQDAGRPGFRHLGAPLSGAADRLSFALANVAVGNDWDAPGLECALTGPTLRFAQESVVAIAGADMPAMLNGAPIAPMTPCAVKSGDELSIGAARTGARSYIAFAGGIAGARFLGSSSTYLPAGLGGVEGRALRQGDHLAAVDLPFFAPSPPPLSLAPHLTHEWILRAIPGPELSVFDADFEKRLFTTPFTAGQRGDRMGVRLIGGSPATAAVAQMKSSPVFPGTVQCPPDGAPLLLLCDAQTVGGYPRIAQIIAADLHLAGQIRPGDKIWLRRSSVDTARDILTQRTAYVSSFIPGFRFC